MSQQYQSTGRSAQQSRGSVGFQQGQTGAQSSQQGPQQSQQQGGVQQGQQQGFQPAHFDEALPSEYRAALDDLSWLRKQTKWASEQAHRKLQGTGIETTLEDVSEIAELNVELLLSNSKFVQYEIDTFRRVATEAIQQLQQYQQEPFVDAVVSDLSRAIHSAEELLVKSQGSSQQSGGQQGGQSQVAGGSQSRTQGQSATPPQQTRPQIQTQPQQTQTQPQQTQQPLGQSQY